MWVLARKAEQSTYFRVASMMIFLLFDAVSVTFAEALTPQGTDTSVLRRFEKGVQPAPERQSEPRYVAPSRASREDGNGIGDDLAQDFTDAVMDLVIAGGQYTMQRVAPGADDLLRRNAGEPLIPFVRYDFAYQNVSPSIDARIHRFESGYGPIAVLLENFTFNERVPSNTLKVERQMILYRMSVGNEAEVDVGIGKSVITGMQRTMIDVISLPVKFMISENVSVELRPTWGGTVDDYEVALHWGMQFGSLKAGYRILSSPDASLNGPFAGIALYY